MDTPITSLSTFKGILREKISISKNTTDEQQYNSTRQFLIKNLNNVNIQQNLSLIHEYPSVIQAFQQHLNILHPTIKFTINSLRTNMHLLNLVVTIEGVSCYAEAYFKPTNTFSRTMRLSRHPKLVFRTITKGENIRILRNCGYTLRVTQQLEKINQLIHHA